MTTPEPDLDPSGEQSLDPQTPAGPSASPLMQLESVSKVFDRGGNPFTAVAQVDLSLVPGQVVCLVGQSGSGKTTLARIAAGLSTPTDGVVRFDGKDVASLSRSGRRRFRQQVQYVHQDPYASLNPTRSVASTLMSALRANHRGMTRREARLKAIELLERVGLRPPADYVDKYPHQLSGGQ